MNFENYYPFSAAPLPYELEALRPYISEYTLYFHHDKHYKDYLNKLNMLVKASPLMQNVPLEALTKMEDEDIRKNAGGVYNHELYFYSLTPDYKDPSPKLQKLINQSFGSEKEMFDTLIDEGMGLTGSGYVWLAENHNGMLEILVTPNQETIDFDKFTPLLNVDLWEHSYYLDKQNRRRDYLNSIRNVLDWDAAEKRLEK